jgi:hypothetical protein
MRQGPGKKPKKGPPPPSVHSQSASEDDENTFDNQIYGDREDVEYTAESGQFERHRDGTYVRAEAAYEYLASIYRQSLPLQPVQALHADTTAFQLQHPTFFQLLQYWPAPTAPQNCVAQTVPTQQYYRYAVPSQLPLPEPTFALSPSALGPDRLPLGGSNSDSDVTLNLQELLSNIFTRLRVIEHQQAEIRDRHSRLRRTLQRVSDGGSQNPESCRKHGHLIRK